MNSINCSGSFTPKAMLNRANSAVALTAQRNGHILRPVLPVAETTIRAKPGRRIRQPVRADPAWNLCLRR